MQTVSALPKVEKGKIMQEEFLLRIEDLRRRCDNKNIVTYTSFLTPAEKKCVEKKNYRNILIFGGTVGAERCRIFFLNDNSDFDVNDYISAFEIDFKFENLTHKDFLGALIGLGIKRESIGDIYVFENKAYFFVTKEIEKFIQNNLDKVGRAGVIIKKINNEDVKPPVLKTEEVKFTVQTVRLDSIIAGGFRISREDAVRLIKLGIVMKDYEVCDNSSVKIETGAVISARGYGKFKVDEIGGVSKKERIFVKVSIYR